MTKEVKIGLIGIAALAMLIYGINYLKGINMFQSANYYYVEYTNINGLAGSSPVFANGFKVLPLLETGTRDGRSGGR